MISYFSKIMKIPKKAFISTDEQIFSLFPLKYTLKKFYFMNIIQEKVLK